MGPVFVISGGSQCLKQGTLSKLVEPIPDKRPFSTCFLPRLRSPFEKKVAMSSSFAVSRALYVNVHALNIANQLARQAAQMLPISTFVHMTEEDDFGRPLPNPSPLFNSPTADLVLSSSNSYHVRTGPCGKAQVTLS
jgi:hypothetical protein